jgi:hypothetical protein
MSAVGGVLEFVEARLEVLNREKLRRLRRNKILYSMLELFNHRLSKIPLTTPCQNEEAKSNSVLELSTQIEGLQTDRTVLC